MVANEYPAQIFAAKFSEPLQRFCTAAGIRARFTKVRGGVRISGHDGSAMNAVGQAAVLINGSAPRKALSAFARQHRINSVPPPRLNKPLSGSAPVTVTCDFAKRLNIAHQFVGLCVTCDCDFSPTGREVTGHTVTPTQGRKGVTSCDLVAKSHQVTPAKSHRFHAGVALI